MTRSVAVFARPPVPGRVKTRLAPALSEALACELYRACLEDALAAARGARADARWIYWAEPPGPEAEGFGVRMQRGSDLGERLAAAFEERLAAPGDRAAFLGADCPELSATRIDTALAALDSADVVLGPTRDGGYYLVALQRPAPTLFEGIEWSTERVLAQTLERAREAGLRVERLDPLEDLDTPADLIRLLARQVRGGAPTAPATRAALREKGLLPGADPDPGRRPG